MNVNADIQTKTGVTITANDTATREAFLRRMNTAKTTMSAAVVAAGTAYGENAYWAKFDIVNIGGES